MAPEVTIPTSNELVRSTRPEFERMIRPPLSASLAQFRCYEPVPTVRPAAAAPIPLVAASEAKSLDARVGVDPNLGTVGWPAEVSVPATGLVSREADLPVPTARQPRQRRFSQGGPQ